jgi:aminoacyl tRNA synthase complex-interacting multifunctional protein 1
MAAINNIKYTPTEEAEINQWLTTSSRLQSPSGSQTPLLDTLNTHLASRTTLLGSKPSKADIALYEALAPQVSKWTPEQRTGEHGHPNIVRHLDFVQNSPLFGLNINEAEKVKINVDEVLYVKPPVDAKAEKERLKKEKATAAAAGAAAAGEQATLADRTKNADEKDKGVVEKAKEKVVEATEKVIAALAGDSAAQATP